MGHSTRFPSARPLDVLLVEDSDTDAIWIEHLFSRARDGAYKRTRVGALKEAAELADARAFDVALLDLNLPDSHGVETLTRLRARAPSLPIVVLTGIDDDHLVANTLELGAEDYLTKGHVNAEILERAIRYAIHRMRAEELLRQREKEARTVADNAPDLIARFDRDLRHTYVNRRVEDFTGLKAAEFLHRTNAELGFPSSLVQTWDRALHKAFRDGQPAELEFEHESPQGPRVYEARLFPEPDERGEVVSVLCFTRDVTSLRKLVADLKGAEEQLFAAQKMEAIGQLAGGVAHDFNNLMTIVTGYGALMLKQIPQGDPKRGALEAMLRAGDRASALTRQLLAFSRRQVIVPRVMDLNASVEEARKSMKRMLREDIELNVALAPELWKVYVDPVQLEQILINLVVNARDAMPEGGALTIETRNEAWDAAYVKQHPPAKPGNHVVLAIADTGVGMDEATRKRIFEPFFSTKGPGMGAGLGLSTVYGIVKQNQGYIWVRSQPGSGTTFEVCFPATQAEETAPAAKPAAKPHAGGPETILVVEDEEWVRNLILEILRAEGYQTLIARDGMDALEQAAQHAGPIHLLATDVVMPRMNGKELARKLIETRKELKVLFISGYADSVLYHHGVLDPGIQLLQKPFTPDELAAKVREVLKPPDREAQAPA